MSHLGLAAELGEVSNVPTRATRVKQNTESSQAGRDLYTSATNGNGDAACFLPCTGDTKHAAAPHQMIRLTLMCPVSERVSLRKCQHTHSRSTRACFPHAGQKDTWKWSSPSRTLLRRVREGMEGEGREGREADSRKEAGGSREQAASDTRPPHQGCNTIRSAPLT
ncbi:hypothetical protein E2C01_099676 [Portunus trituberculatus]|uniref:Uncharacterized protein n=1 Tax=Portunus trituberculatus TaxID=210409 RepID=A0A5B7KFZ2_PORTR|nr:hypothetical protein [Portunus trituberculatus]